MQCALSSLSQLNALRYAWLTDWLCACVYFFSSSTFACVTCVLHASTTSSDDNNIGHFLCFIDSSSMAFRLASHSVTHTHTFAVSFNAYIHDMSNVIIKCKSRDPKRTMNLHPSTKKIQLNQQTQQCVSPVSI